MRTEHYSLRWKRTAYAQLDRNLYLIIACSQVLLIRFASSNTIWAQKTLVFLVLAVLALLQRHARHKPLHGVYDTSTSEDRRRQRMNLMIACCLYLLSSCFVYLKLHLPTTYAETLIAKPDADQLHTVRILSSDEGAYGTEAVASIDDRVTIYLRLPDSKPLEHGDRFVTKLQFSRPDTASNPGGFDEASYYRSRGIFLMASISDDALWTQKHTRLINWPQRALDRMNEAVSTFFMRLFGEEEGAIASAMLLGNEGRLTKAVKDDFKHSGLSHLLVVSGSNVSLIFTLILPLLQKSGLRWRWRQLALLPALIFFGALIRWDASVTRAISMNLVMVFARLLKRPIHASTALGMGLCFILAFNPLAALSLGFLMSAAVSYVLLIVLMPLSERLIDASVSVLGLRRTWLLTSQTMQNRVRMLAVAFLTPILAQLAVFPFTMSMGSDLSIWTVVLNWAAVPLTASLTILLTIAAPLLLLEAVVSQAALQWMTKPIRILLLCIRRLAGVPADLDAGSVPADKKVFIIYLALLLLILCFMKRCSLRHFRNVMLLYGSSVAIFALVLYLRSPLLTIYCLDVGQGDAALLRLRSGETVLIDTGTETAGTRVIPAALKKLGIRQIDLLIISHMHMDHMGAASSLIEDGLVRMLILPPAIESRGEEAARERALQEDLKEQMAKLGLWSSSLAAGDTLRLGSNYSLTCLWPERSDVGYGNDASLVLELVGQGLEFLFTGDCEQKTEEALLRSGQWNDMDILKVSHHGSKTSTSEAFLLASSPELAVISVGRNTYGHPNDAVLQSLQANDAFVYRTDTNGAIVVESRRGLWTAYSYKNKALRLRGN